MNINTERELLLFIYVFLRSRENERWRPPLQVDDVLVQDLLPDPPLLGVGGAAADLQGPKMLIVSSENSFGLYYCIRILCFPKKIFVNVLDTEHLITKLPPMILTTCK